MAPNGQIPDSELTRVATGPAWLDGGKGMRLAKVTAQAFRNMNLAAIAGGVPGGIWPAFPAGCYRSLATQRQMKDPKTAPNFGLNPASTVSIANPGYSTHGDGRAVDIGSFPRATHLDQWGQQGRKRREWLLANAHRYGFARQFGESDPNHFRHDGKTTGPGSVAGGAVTPIEKEDDMEYTDWSEKSRKALVKDITDALVTGTDYASKFKYLTDRVKTLVDPFEWEHPDPAKAAEGIMHKDSLLNRAGAVHVDTYRAELALAEILEVLRELVEGGVPTSADEVTESETTPAPTAEEIARAVRKAIIAPE